MISPYAMLTTALVWMNERNFHVYLKLCKNWDPKF